MQIAYQNLNYYHIKLIRTKICSHYKLLAQNRAYDFTALTLQNGQHAIGGAMHQVAASKKHSL